VFPSSRSSLRFAVQRVLLALLAELPKLEDLSGCLGALVVAALALAASQRNRLAGSAAAPEAALHVISTKPARRRRTAGGPPAPERRSSAGASRRRLDRAPLTPESWSPRRRRRSCRPHGWRSASAPRAPRAR